jgi:hypothetical protein
MNLDAGASEWMTLPPSLERRFRWKAPPGAGPLATNNQTGTTAVRLGHLVGPLCLTGVAVYLNPEAEDPCLGSALLRGRRVDP